MACSTSKPRGEKPRKPHPDCPLYPHASGYQNQLLDRPVRYGTAFQKPSQRVLRLARQENGSKMFEPHELRLLLAAAPLQLRTMLLLGLNAGFWPGDIGRLPLSALDLEGGWIDYPRHKTGVPRWVPLWSETVQALQDVLATRPAAQDPQHNMLVFLRVKGGPWRYDSSREPVTMAFRELLRAHGL